MGFDGSPAEIAPLKEYVKTMCPLAKAVDVLQGEASVMMGWLVPTITLLKSKPLAPLNFLQLWWALDRCSSRRTGKAFQPDSCTSRADCCCHSCPYVQDKWDE